MQNPLLDFSGLPRFTDFVWSGDIGVASPGHATWIEYDLKPGHYLLACWSSEEGAPPAVFFGMAHGFTVQ